MRLPTENGKGDGPVDEKEASRCVRYAIDHGVNYVDAAKVYHEGKAEEILGRILRDGYREKVAIATKLPIWDVRSRKDADRIFDEQRRDLGTEKIDVYLLHNIQRNYRKILEDARLAEWAYEKKEKGEIDYVGFSFHDDYEFFVEILDSFDSWDFCQLQYNYVNTDVQAGKRGVRLARERGLSVVVMEPLLGGCLARPSGDMESLFQSEEGKKFDPVELAFRWIWSQPETSVVLSGMSSFEQVEQNIRIVESESYATLTPEESTFIEKLQKVYDESMPIKCTKCRYCMPCPVGVDIPLNFELFNNHSVMTKINPAATLNKLLYGTFEESQKAGSCIRCGTCEENCPQQLRIPDLLENVRQTFGS